MDKTFWVVEKRRELINKAFNILKSKGKVEYKEAVASICVDTGLREVKVKEYLNILKDSGSIKIDKGIVEVI